MIVAELRKQRKQRKQQAKRKAQIHAICEREEKRKKKLWNKIYNSPEHKELTKIANKKN